MGKESGTRSVGLTTLVIIMTLAVVVVVDPAATTNIAAAAGPPAAATINNTAQLQPYIDELATAGWTINYPVNWTAAHAKQVTGFGDRHATFYVSTISSKAGAFNLADVIRQHPIPPGTPIDCNTIRIENNYTACVSVVRANDTPSGSEATTLILFSTIKNKMVLFSARTLSQHFVSYIPTFLAMISSFRIVVPTFFESPANYQVP